MVQLAESPVPVKRLLGFTEEDRDEQGFYARDSFKVAWADRWRWMLWADGVPTRTGGPQGSITLNVPLVYPDQPGLFAIRISPKGVGASAVPGQPYDHARFDVEFRTPPWNYDDEVWLSEDWAGSASMVTLPNRPYHFADGTPVPSDVGRRVTLVEVTLTRHRVPSLDLVQQSIFDLSGTINATTFRGRPPGHVMFVGPDTSFEGYWSGMFNFDVRYKFIYRSIHWNFFLNPNTSDFEVITDGNGDPVYPSADHNDLFSPFA